MEMKLCRYCLHEKPADTFGQAATINGKVYRRHRCAECKNAIQTKRIQRLRLWIENYKKARCCERCGYADYRALMFHHLDKDAKLFAVAQATSYGRSLASVQREIAKCALLCANCHAIEHYYEPQ